MNPRKGFSFLVASYFSSSFHALLLFLSFLIIFFSLSFHFHGVEIRRPFSKETSSSSPCVEMISFPPPFHHPPSHTYIIHSHTISIPSIIYSTRTLLQIDDVLCLNMFFQFNDFSFSFSPLARSLVVMPCVPMK